jgi:hypothetical protein
MKFVISFLVTLNAFASPIQVFYEVEPSRAQIVKDILLNQYSIPEELIAVKEIGVCENLKVRGKFDLCLKNNGDLIVVSVDRGFVNESLKIFQAP